MAPPPPKETKKGNVKTPTATSAVPAVTLEPGGDRPLAIVGLGASAGGLEAFEQFLRQVPPHCGLAFVLLPHLDPNHASLLAEILQRTTTMPVMEARDQMLVTADSVTIIPPNRDMVIFQGRLQLVPPEKPRGQRLSIDTFFCSLAEDQGGKAVGVILSGTGSDGTLGLCAILKAGGVTMVQDPATARYDGMPVSAIHAGYATLVLPVEKMPEALLVSLKRVMTPRPLPPLQKTAINCMNRILMLLRSTTGHDFSLYKKSTIDRRIKRRMAQHDIDDLALYTQFLKEHPAEVPLLFKELLINVTRFFRDPEAFDALKKEFLTHLFADKPENYILRLWVPACATGEEAYSIAILLREAMDESHREFRVQIYSTDINPEDIATARNGKYPATITQEIAPDRLRRFFYREDGHYRVKKEIREMVIFATQDIIKDPPFTRMDLVSCRNLMIYLTQELQHHLISVFNYALKPGGTLFLSPSESVGKLTNLFTPLNRKWKLYRVLHASDTTQTAFRSNFSRLEKNGGTPFVETTRIVKEANFVELTRRMLIQSFAPPSVVTNTKGDILFVHGETGSYLHPAPGPASLNVFDMANNGLKQALRLAMPMAATQGTPTLNQQVSLKSAGPPRLVSLSVRRLLPDTDTRQSLLLVSFQEVTAKPPNRRKHAAGKGKHRQRQELEHELVSSKENLQATIEEQQVSNEELKSSNEELQSTNEELQSTQEELETSNEELKSVNEELVTVNAELEAKIEQLAVMQNDIKNLLDNISVGSIILDQDLTIRRFTREATRIYRLVNGDVGRFLGDIKSDIEDTDLLSLAREVLITLIPCELEACTSTGTWHLVRMMPYRTQDNVIDGVVLTFTDISVRIKDAATRKTLEEALALAQGVVNTVVVTPLVVLDQTLRIVMANRLFYQWFRVSQEETVGRLLHEWWELPALRQSLENVLRHDQALHNLEVTLSLPARGPGVMGLTARRLTDKNNVAPWLILTLEKITQGVQPGNGT